MQRRLELHEVLCDILGSRNVYFQPPASLQMQFPCILYSLAKIKVEHGDNSGYHRRDCYTIIYVDRNPDSEIPDKIGNLELSSFDRFYTSDNFNNFVYTLYF